MIEGQFCPLSAFHSFRCDKTIQWSYYRHSHTHTHKHTSNMTLKGGNQSGCEPQNSEKIMLLVKSILDF